MKISVVIPTYNSAATIKATLESVLSQSAQPDEILILDDGSTDNTVAILNSYKPRISVFQQKNKGVANARNFLCSRATGDLVAFLDHDDIWHPRYLEVQSTIYLKYPQAVAFFAGHVNFYGYENYVWDYGGFEEDVNADIIYPLSFLIKYNTVSALFGSASFFCVPKRVLIEIGSEPFCEKVSGVDDSYFCTLLPLIGPVVYCSLPLVAYRITKEAQSTNKLKAFELWTDVFQLLENQYSKLIDTKLSKAFFLAFASQRRQYAKRLMSAGRVSDARKQLCYSLGNSFHYKSIVKSMLLLFLTYMPAFLQPKWPPIYRS